MAGNLETITTVRDAFRILWRHKKKVVFCFLATMIVPVTVIIFAPRSYLSEARLFVRVGRESVTLDPTATTGETISIWTTREFEINSILEMLSSRAIAEKVVDSIGVDVLLGRSPRGAAKPAGRQWLPETWTKWIPDLHWAKIPRLDPISDREAAINLVADRVSVSASRKSNIIEVYCRAETPELAQKMAASLVDIYVTEHARFNRTEGSPAFFDEQTALLKGRLNSSLERLQDAKNGMGLVSINNQREILQNEIIAVETDRAQTQASLAGSEGRLIALREAVVALPERVTTDEISGYPNLAADQMRDRLYDLEIQEAELASKFADDYPRLVAVRRQVEEAKQILNGQEARRTQWTSTVNTTRQQLQFALLEEESNAQSLAARVQSLDRQFAELQQRARLLNQQEVQIAQLEAQVELCRSGYMTYSEKLEQSRIDEALQSERITNVNLVQPANYIGEPISPNKAGVLALGLLVASCMGAGVALLAEYLDPSLKTPAEVEQKLALPVLVSVPKVPRRHVMVS